MVDVKGNIITLNSGKTIIIKPLDACKLFVDISKVAYIDIDKDHINKIQKISLEGKFDIELSDQFKVKIGDVDSVYDVKYIIVSKDKKSIILFSSTPNKTSTYLLPLLNRSRKSLKFESYYVGTFLDETGKYLLLLYRFTGTEIYKQFEDSMLNDTLCVGHHEYNPYHVMYRFRVPEEYYSDIEHFKKGKYSRFSKKLKSQILKFYGGDTNISQIVNRSETLRKQIEEELGVNISDELELASKPILTEEIYNIK